MAFTTLGLLGAHKIIICCSLKTLSTFWPSADVLLYWQHYDCDIHNESLGEIKFLHDFKRFL
jgi:hypothetical protein